MGVGLAFTCTMRVLGVNTWLGVWSITDSSHITICCFQSVWSLLFECPAQQPLMKLKQSSRFSDYELALWQEHTIMISCVFHHDREIREGSPHSMATILLLPWWACWQRWENIPNSKYLYEDLTEDDITLQSRIMVSSSQHSR